MNILKLLAVNAESGGGNQSLYDIINGLGLTTNLKLCLDAGDDASYDPAVQTTKWLDTSGNGYDFFRGATGSSEGSDPTFNGSAGGLSSSEYWSFDGADYFTYDTSNETWMENLHKNNAVFSFVVAFYKPASNSLIRIFSTNSATNAVGIRILTTNVGNVTLVVSNGATTQIFVNLTSASPSGWNVLALSYTESSGSWSAILNGTTYSGTQTYTSPSASASTQTAKIGTVNGTSSINSSGTLYACHAMWEGTALTSTNLTDLYDGIKGRFGL